MISYIAQTRQSMATAGNNILFGGGEMWSARPHSISVPPLNQLHHSQHALNMCQSLSPFHVQMRSNNTLRHAIQGVAWCPLYDLQGARRWSPTAFPIARPCSCLIYKDMCTHKDILSLYKYTTSILTTHLHIIFTILYNIFVLLLLTYNVIPL